tara:strand:- start:346 stop:762 length:417 start_codon:yes stop_codon:yes gene_type:complete
MSETLSRILKREQPKWHIIEGMVTTLFKKTDAKEAIISIKPNKLTRSGQQNKLYWSIIEQVRVETKNSKDAIHDHLRGEFLETTTETVCKKQHIVLKSTTTLNTKEMGIYLDECIVFAEEYVGIRLNLPDNWRGLIVE